MAQVSLCALESVFSHVLRRRWAYGVVASFSTEETDRVNVLCRWVNCLVPGWGVRWR